jgi:hypothetical protein
MVYNCRDATELGGRELIGARTDASKKARGTLALLILAALAATIFIGCGGGSPQSSGDRQESEPAGSPGRESEDTSASGRPPGGELGHPTLGSADASVVLTEYSDYQ